MPTDPSSPHAVERRHQRLPDNHPAVERLRILGAAVAKLREVAEAAAHAENNAELSAALAELDKAANSDLVPRGQ